MVLIRSDAKARSHLDYIIIKDIFIVVYLRGIWVKIVFPLSIQASMGFGKKSVWIMSGFGSHFVLSVNLEGVVMSVDLLYELQECWCALVKLRLGS